MEILAASMPTLSLGGPPNRYSHSGGTENPHRGWRTDVPDHSYPELITYPYVLLVSKH